MCQSESKLELVISSTGVAGMVEKEVNHLLLYATMVQNMEVVTSLQMQWHDSAVAIGHDIPQVSGIIFRLGNL